MTFKRCLLFCILAAVLIVQDIVPLFLVERYFYIFNTSVQGNVLVGFVLFLQIVLSLIMILLYKNKGLVLACSVLIFNFMMMLSVYVQFRDISVIHLLGIILSSLFSVSVIGFLIHRSSDINHSLIEIANTDYLTGANNMRCFENDLHEFVKKHSRFAIMLIDLDSFKHINEVRGYKCGNEVLRHIVSRLRNTLELNDSIYRINGDVFAIIFNNHKDKTDLDNRIAKVSSVFEKPVLTGKYENFICACGGVVEYPENSSKVEQLRQFADAALSDAKKKAKGKDNFTFCTFNADTLKSVKRTLYISDLLQKAVDSNLLTLMFHPQYDVKTKKLHGFECLLRMHDFDGNEISPEEFIPIAEEQGFIYDIGRWVIESGIKSFKSALDKASPENKNVTVSINISCIQFLEDSFINYCKKIIDESEINVKNLVFELTESVLINSADKAVKLIKELNASGIKVSMDDFGTGYSSLSYIYQFDFNELKIDKSFTDLIGCSKKNDDFIKILIDTCHKFGIQVVTEGVENEQQYKKLLDDGCDIIQGYYFSRPIDEKCMIEMLASND